MKEEYQKIIRDQIEVLKAEIPEVNALPYEWGFEELCNFLNATDALSRMALLLPIEEAEGIVMEQMRKLLAFSKCGNIDRLPLDKRLRILASIANVLRGQEYGLEDE